LSKLLGSALLIFMSGTKLSLFVTVVLAWALAHGQNQQREPVQALQTLNHYIQLRLQDADWKEYSKLITWPDEPSWDCRWVVNAYHVGTPSKGKGNVIIPIAYKRLGLYCDNFYFEPGVKTATINYELVKSRHGWRVNGPPPDYPDVGADVLIGSLRATANNAKESPEHRAQSEEMAHQIAEALAAGRNASP
jgi:hypothetical protein